MSEKMPALVVYSWDGTSKPLEHVRPDTEPDFELCLFDYSGAGVRPCDSHFISVKCEGKGQVMAEIHHHFGGSLANYEYIGVIDDDIGVAYSDLNTLLAIARRERLDSFAPVLSDNSYCAHERFRQQKGGGLRYLSWVEIMTPFYRPALYLRAAPFFRHSISSHGLDDFVMTTVQKLNGQERVAVIDAVVVDHLRPITSHQKIFSHGCTALDERSFVRRMAMAEVARERPDLVGTHWYLSTFSPLNGPGRFWWLRLRAPWLWWRYRDCRRAPRPAGAPA